MRPSACETSPLVEDFFSLFFLFLCWYHILPAQLARNDFVRRLFSAQFTTPRCVPFSWDYHKYIWWNHRLHGLGLLVSLQSVSFCHSRWSTVNLPWVQTGFWLPRLGKCCWTWSSVKNLVFSTFYLFTFTERSFIMQILSYFWPSFGWIVTETQFQRYDCCTHNFWLMNSTAESAEQYCSLLAFASNWDLRFPSAIQNMGCPFFGNRAVNRRLKWLGKRFKCLAVATWKFFGQPSDSS